MVALLGLAALVPGFSATGTYALGWTAQTNYLNSTYVSGSISAPSGLSAAASGNTVNLAWADGTNGNQQNVAVTGPQTSSACSSSNSFSPVATIGATATTFTDATTPVTTGVQPGDYLCYQLLNGYGYGTSTLSAALTSTANSLPLSSLPGPVVSGDTLDVLNSSNQYQSFTASQSYAATSSPTSVSVTTATTTATFGIGSTVTDAAGWTSWTSPTSAAGSYASAQAGFAADSVALPRSSGIGTSDSMTGGTVTVTFDQAPSATLPTGHVCVFDTSPYTVLLGDTTATTTSVGGVTLSSSSTTATKATNWTGLTAGMFIYDGAYIAADTTVVSVTGRNLVMSAKPTASAASQTLSFSSCAKTDAYSFGKLVLSGTGVSLSTSNIYTGTATLAGNAITFPLTSLTVGSTASTVQVPTGDTPVWTFTPATSLVSSTGAVGACVTNTHLSTLCQPQTSTSF